MKFNIILGLGFGDEGKGSFTNYCSNNANNPLVIRFNGGHQVGHTVVNQGFRHVFSNFGSGTLAGVPTYWSEFCTVDPMGMRKEFRVLEEMQIIPTIYYNANAMVTTPYDIYENITNDANIVHGSVGVGFGKTIQRNEDMYHLYVRDLKYPVIRDQKIKLIGELYYKEKWQNGVIDEFKKACDFLVERSIIVNNLKDIHKNNMDLIFEGGQGIMLDMNYGFFPNVTRSNTTSKNAIEIIHSLGIAPTKYNTNTFYITRAYQTRHGNGFMSNVGMDTSYIKENSRETNVNGGYQGNFRKSVLDLDLLSYSLECDKYHNFDSKKYAVITCLDQVPDKIPVTRNGILETMRYYAIGKNLGISDVYPTYNESGFTDKY